MQLSSRKYVMEQMEKVFLINEATEKLSGLR